MMTRSAAWAGMFYPGRKAPLNQAIRRYIEEVPKGNGVRETVRLRGAIVPHSGYCYSGPTAAHAYRLIKDTEVEDVVVIGPSHHLSLDGLVLSDFSWWETPLGKVRPSSLTERLRGASSFTFHNGAHTFDHSVEVQLPFLQWTCPDFGFTPILAGKIADPTGIVRVISSQIGERTVLVASSDLSHFLEYSAAKAADQATIRKILDRSPTLGPLQACGYSAINILLEIARLQGWDPVLLNSMNSGDVTGERESVVGYTAIAFFDS